MHKPMWIRMVIVKGYNDDRRDLRKRLQFVASLGSAVQRVELLPYHALGEGKYKAWSWHTRYRRMPVRMLKRWLIAWRRGEAQSANVYGKSVNILAAVIRFHNHHILYAVKKR